MAVTWGDVLAFMDRFLAAVAAIVLAVIVLALAVYILAYFQHPDDVTQSWWAPAGMDASHTGCLAEKQ